MSDTEAIKARLDLVDVVQSYVQLKKAGRNFKGLCPFHNEKTPSFVVFPETQTWRCFGACGEGGDVFSFVMKMEGYDFPEALRILAERAGVELQPRSPEAAAQHETLDRLRGMLAEAADFYLKLLLDTPQAEHVRRYVAGRGLHEETVRAFGLGFAPDSWQITLDHLTELGYSVEDVLEAGLASRSDSGRVYDRFRNRLMIPIRDSRGRVVGFGARALSDDQVPKYLNSPQNELFDKSQLLYGLDMARRAIRETETVVVVEGYMDVIQAYQAGYENVVAQMGTALTGEQAQLLARYAHRLILALDSDNAGVRATMRGLNVVNESLRGDDGAPVVTFDARGMMSLAGQLKLDTRILTLPDGQDPDDFIRNAPDAWPQAVEAATPLADYVIEIGTAGINAQTDIHERERVAQSLLPLLTATENDLLRNQNIQRLAMRLHIPERDLLAWAAAEQPGIQPRPQARRQRDEPPPWASPAPQRPQGTAAPQQTPASAALAQLSGRAKTLERYTLSMLLHEPLLVFAADRKFRQLALLAEGDEVAVRRLGPFGQPDFTRSDFQALLQVIRRAAEQDELEPPEHVKQTLTPELEQVVEEVLPEPLEVFHQRTSDMHRKALQNVLRQKRFDPDRALEAAEFLRCALNMRLERIEREMSELYFLDRDHAQDPSADEAPVDYQLVRGLARAKSLIQDAVSKLHDKAKD